MLSKVEVRTPQGTTLSLPLEDYDNGFLIEEITGLDPVKAVVASSPFANQPGETYHGSRREKRNIKLKIGMYPDFVDTSVQSLRDTLYSFLMPQSEVYLRFFMTNGLQVDILGTVESNDTPHFTREPRADISILCFNPDFVGPNVRSVSGMSTADSQEVTTSINYAGNAPAGVLFTIESNRVLPSFSIYHLPPSGVQQQLDFTAPLIANGTVVISSIPKAKGATLTRDNTVSSILYGVSPQSAWLELKKGINNLRVYSVGASVPYTVQYVTRYGGL